jgi:hypothetical protein
MKDIDDLFLKAHYSDLTPNEQTLIEDLCSDEVSFQQVKVLVTRSMDVLPVSPPAHLLEALNQTFDQTYSQPSAKGMRPRMFNLFIASAVAATVLIFLTVYYFGINNEPQEQLTTVEKKEQKKKNNETKASTIVEKTQTPKVASLEPIPAPPVALDLETQNDVLMDEPAVIASIEMEDAKQEELRGSRSDVEAVSRDRNATYNEPKSNTYMWTSADKHLASDQVVIAQESRKKQTKSDSKRLNTSLMLKQIKPVY